MNGSIVLTDFFYVDGIHAFFPFLQIELHLIPFPDRLCQSTGVYKSFFSGIIVLDESKPLFAVKKLNGA